MTLQLTVTAGPEAGKSARFEEAIVAVGRGPRNDLVLRDGLISQYHGEFVLRDHDIIYRDLRSRHGTLVKVGHITVHLHDRRRVSEISLVDGAQLMLGETLVRVGMRRAQVESAKLQLDSAESTLDERIITRSRDSLEKVAERLSSRDPRLMSIFKLSRQLNATTELEALLDLIVDVTFEAFNAANFFAITLFSEEQLDDDDLGRIHPLIARDRDPSTSLEGTPLLSSSLLKRVATSRESVLFVRDEAGEDVTESIINARISACLAAPLVGQNKLIGVMQADTRGRGSLFAADDLDLFTVMASYAAFAIERVRLSKNIVDMFDGIVQASVSAIDARDPATAGHSHRVADMMVALAQRINHTETGPLGSLSFSAVELQELRYAALLHDFGKIGVRESVLVKAERLYPRQRGELCQRFETVKASLSVRRQRRLLERLARTNEVPDAATLEALEREIGRVTAELDELLDYVLSHQALERIDSSVVARIREIGDLTYTDLDGQTHPYLRAEEIESLSILFGTLTDEEIEHIRSHASLSRDYLSHIPWSDQLAQIPCIAGWHHEKLDGSGYPDGISGDAIPPQVRMLTICDIFDALTAVDRPYRRAVSVPAALEVLRAEGEQGLLDLDLLAIFAEMVSERWEPPRSKASQV